MPDYQKVKWRFTGFTFECLPLYENIDPNDPVILANVIKPTELAVMTGAVAMLLQREMKGLYRLNWKLKQMLQYKQDLERLNHKGSVKQEANNGKSNDRKKEDDRKSKKISNKTVSRSSKN